MPCIERGKAPWWAGLAVLAGCSAPAPSTAPAPPARSAGVASPTPPAPPATSPLPAAAAPGSAPVRLPAPGSVRNWNEVRHQAALRLVAANPGMTYSGTVPDILLAIAVLEVELNADGSVRRIELLRRPGQAGDTVQLAIDAVRRAAPFGDVSRLPKPWKFVETFLFDDDRRFKPRTLDR